jgi:hypothetical protein
VDVLSLQIFVSLVLVFGSVLFFAFATRGKDHQHAERLSLLPLERDESPRDENLHEEPK